MNKYLLIALVLLVVGFAVLLRSNNILKKENDRQAGNVAALVEGARSYKIRDSLSASSVAVLRFTIDELTKYRAADMKLIKELKLKAKDVEYITNTEVITRDSLVFKTDSVGCFHYLDKWLRVDACTSDSSMIIESRDSIAQVVHAIYKHRFLWWRWKVVGFRQEVVSFNPHSKIGYSEIIKIKK